MQSVAKAGAGCQFPLSLTKHMHKQLCSSVSFPTLFRHVCSKQPFAVSLHFLSLFELLNQF